MAIAKAGTDTTTQVTTNSFSWSHTLVAGSHRIIIVNIGGETTLADSSPIWYATGVTYGGEDMTQCVHVETTETAAGNSNNSNEIWYILEDDLPANGSNTISVTGAGATAPVELFGVCAEYTGVKQEAPDLTNGIFVNATAPSDTISNTLSPDKDSLVVSSYVCGNVGSFTVGQSQVEILDAAQTTTTFGSCELVGAAGTETSFSSTYATGANRLTRGVASFLPFRGWKINTISSDGDVGKVNTIELADIGKINDYITT